MGVLFFKIKASSRNPRWSPRDVSRRSSEKTILSGPKTSVGKVECSDVPETKLS